jgi:menaquinone-dependent protoporphyrinogen IX oxidase
MRKILKIVVIAIAVIVILIVSAVAAISLDAASFTATGTQTLNARGTQVGRALVVYDPGFSGAAKTAAQKIADDLQSNGYTVELAGVRSQTAGNASGYDIVVVGGPMYFGEATSSIEGYLNALTLSSQTKLGVYVTTGSSQFVNSDYQSLQQQVTSATSNSHSSNVAVKMVLDGNETQNCADLISALT